MNRKTLLPFALVLFLAFGAAACGGGEAPPADTGTPSSDSTPQEPSEPDTSEPDGPKVVTWSYHRGARSLDAHDQRGSPDYQLVMYSLFNGLVRMPDYFPDNGAPMPQPDLATEWNVSDDGLVWTFKLREGVQFHKGYGTLTANDVKYSYERLMDPDTELIRSGDVRNIEKVEVIDDLTVAIHLKNASAAFLMDMATLSGYLIVSEKAVEAMGNETFAESPIGTGPYQVESYLPRGEVIFKAFEDYWEGRPEVDEVRVIVQPDETVAALAFLQDEVNWLAVRSDEAYDAVVDQPGVTVVRHPTASYGIEALWLQTEKVTDRRIRHALAYAVDRDTLFEQFAAKLGTSKADTILPPSVFGHRTDHLPKYDYDADRARQLLEDAGVTEGSLTLTTATIGTGGYPDTLTAVQNFWGQVGVNLDFEVVEHAAWQAKYQAGENEFLIVSAGRREPDQVLVHFESTSRMGAVNYMFYNNPQVDELILQQRTELDNDRRLSILHEVQALIMEDLPAIPLYHSAHVTAQRDYIEGPDNVTTWYFKPAAMHFK
ncbi:MAG: ABC transporter substrate-binding protein [Thermaerobacterales bacterium]